MHKLISQYKSQGRVLRRIYITTDWKVYTTRTRTPDTNHLANFNVRAKRGKAILDLIVLDNYGKDDADALPEVFNEALFGSPPEPSLTLAINRITGQCYTARYNLERGDLILTVSPELVTGDALPCVPKEFLPRLDELLNKKRPFNFSIMTNMLLKYTEHWASKDDLGSNFIVSLHLSGPRFKGTGDTRISLWLELCGDSYRVVGGWEVNGWKQEGRRD